MNRREFLSGCGFGLAGLAAAETGVAAAMTFPVRSAREVAADLVIVGGGLGGCAAAMAALERGLTVVLTETTDWIGGQLTSQAVPPDEHPWIERFGCTASYRRLREGIRDHYRRVYPLRAEAAAERDLNPGAGRVSKLCHEPRVALAVLEEMLAPHRSAGRVTVLLRHRPVEVSADGDHVRSVVLEDHEGGRHTVEAAYVLDATEDGDLLQRGDLPAARIDHVVHVVAARRERYGGIAHFCGRHDLHVTRRRHLSEPQAAALFIGHHVRDVAAILRDGG